MAAATNNRNRIWSFQRRDYWDNRYKEQLQGEGGSEPFDWLCTYEAVHECVDRHLANATHVLDIGCGNAAFAAAVSRAHPRTAITGIDYSKLLFDACGTSLGPSGRCGWLVMDARRMAFRSGAFDAILDKGCLDALCAGFDQIAVLRGWGRAITEEEEQRSAAAAASVAELLGEVHRCLAPGGRYLCISYEGPAGRQRFFTGAAQAGTALRLVETVLEEETHNYIYVFVKGDTRSPPEQAPMAAVSTRACGSE